MKPIHDEDVCTTTARFLLDLGYDIVPGRKSRVFTAERDWEVVIGPEDGSSVGVSATLRPLSDQVGKRREPIRTSGPHLPGSCQLPGRFPEVKAAMTLDGFFAGRDDSQRIFDALQSSMSRLGPVELHVTRSQVAFRRRKAFAWAWVPGRYLRGEHAPLVLTFSFRRKDPSKRWNEIVEPTRGRYTHHLELGAVEEIDEEVMGWLREAWEAAG